MKNPTFIKHYQEFVAREKLAPDQLHLARRRLLFHAINSIAISKIEGLRWNGSSFTGEPQSVPEEQSGFGQPWYDNLAKESIRPWRFAHAAGRWLPVLPFIEVAGKCELAKAYLQPGLVQFCARVINGRSFKDESSSGSDSQLRTVITIAILVRLRDLEWEFLRL